MRRSMVGVSLVLFGLAAHASAGCKRDDAGSSKTSADLALVRGSAKVGVEAISRERRVGEGEEVLLQPGARALLRFDGGASALLDSEASLRDVRATSAELEAGRTFFEAPGDQSFTLRTQKGELRFAGAQIAVEVDAEKTSARVIRGSLAYRTSSARGVVDSGQRLTLSVGEPSIEAETLWEDFTGGLAEPGPRDPRDAAGVGVLEGRRPGDFGSARWPLTVRNLDVKVRIVGDLAITELTQTFFNPASATLEGLYRFRVPSGAVLHRFAVDRNGRMVDGYVREKRDAVAAYQAQVYEGSTLDPALLEWDSTGSYRARIHPIEAGESRTIVVRYSEWISPSGDGYRTYRYPMDGGASAPEIEAFSMEVSLDDDGGVRASHGASRDGDTIRLRRSDFRPRADFVLELERSEERARAFRAPHIAPLRDPSSSRRVEEEADYFFLPLTLEPPGNADAQESLDLVIVADLSAGTDRSRLELGRSVIESLSSMLRENDRVAIVGGDVALRVLSNDGALGETSGARVRALLDALARSPGGGASDLGAMLESAAALLDPSRQGAIVYVGDGAPTVGELGAGPLREKLSRLPSPVRIFGVAIGDDANAELLDALSRGGGSVERVTTRAEAAEAAMAVVSSAARPVVSRVVVELGTGIERVFPSDATSAVVGEPLSIIGRIRSAVPTEAKLRYVFRGRNVEQTISIKTETIEDEGDLRLRWAAARLERLLLDGARRTEIVDLGVRAGIVTPFTSLYVPSAAELASLMPSAREALTKTAALDEVPRIRVGERSALAILASPFGALYGCSRSPEAASTASSEDLAGGVGQAPRREAEESAAQGSSAPMERRQGEAQPSEPVAPAPPPSPALAADARYAREEAAPESEAAPAGIGTLGRGGGGGAGSGYGRGGDDAPQARSRRASSSSSSVDEDSRASALEAAAQATRADGARVTVTTSVRVDARHSRRACSEAAGLMLEARANLWRERLARETQPSRWAAIYESALSNCEAPAIRDRRRLLDLVLVRAGSVEAMVNAHREFVSAGARTYLRRAIFSRVRTPEELRIVRAAFGTEAADEQLIEKELAKATSDEARVRILRQLVARFGGDRELSMRLLDGYEGLRRIDDAKQLALTLRADPMTDAGMRTAMGEMFLRLGDEAEARRTFSEIVEFAPNDELARRRLGDLYRAHGWFDDAYRQYTTLAELRPDDPTIFLLLAQAAAGAGRIDEALRLEQRLAETAPAGGAEGTARTAILWSSVRLAELRQRARAANDEEKLRAYTNAMRRGGVFREASELRATLVWSHPDADISLFGAHPGLALARPSDVSPELGLESFDVREREPGVYKLAIRRRGLETRAALEAKLVVVFREGRADEAIVIVPLRFEPGASERSFVIEGDVVRDVGGSR